MANGERFLVLRRNGTNVVSLINKDRVVYAEVAIDAPMDDVPAGVGR